MSTINIPVTANLQTLVGAITTQENTPASLNNPCALVYEGQPGASPSGLSNQLAQFDNSTDGENACYNQIGLYASGSCQSCNGQPQSIESMMQIYAPASAGNDPEAYAQNLADALGVSTDTLVSDAIAGSGGPAVTPTLDTSNLNTFFSSTVPLAGVDIPIWGIAAAAVALLGALWIASR